MARSPVKPISRASELVRIPYKLSLHSPDLIPMDTTIIHALPRTHAEADALLRAEYERSGYRVLHLNDLCKLSLGAGGIVVSYKSRRVTTYHDDDLITVYVGGADAIDRIANASIPLGWRVHLIREHPISWMLTLAGQEVARARSRFRFSTHTGRIVSCDDWSDTVIYDDTSPGR